METPYFETERGVLYHGNCLDIMPQIPAGSIDMILCDLPYGQRIATGIFVLIWSDSGRNIAASQSRTPQSS